ncbi:hypothetical protein [Flaviaesturariibacter terrae]
MNQRHLCAAIACTLALSACTTYQEYEKETKSMRDKSSEYVVQRSDGQRLTGSKLHWSRDNAGRQMIAVDGKAVPEDSVSSYQDKVAVYEKMASGKWVRLLRSGRIRLFHYDERVTTGYHTGAGGSRMADETDKDHYCFAKGANPPAELNRQQIADLLRDNAEAYKLFVANWRPSDKYLPTAYALHQIIKVVDLYNR